MPINKRTTYDDILFEERICEELFYDYMVSLGRFSSSIDEYFSGFPEKAKLTKYRLNQVLSALPYDERMEFLGFLSFINEVCTNRGVFIEFILSILEDRPVHKIVNDYLLRFRYINQIITTVRRKAPH